MQLKNKPTMLMILDGFGLSQSAHGNAVLAAKTPNLDKLFATYPHTELKSSGASVGLPDGQMGNSEVGHLNIGAGRLVYQEYTRITKAIEDKTFSANEALNEAMDYAVNNKSVLHLMGLLSDGGVHSHETHLYALIEMAKQKGVNDVYVHAFLDGRDVLPRSALLFIERLENELKRIGVGKIASITGRYYAMDRDKRWDRIEMAYDALTLGTGIKANSAMQAVEMGYARDENDEFILPTNIGEGLLVNDDDAAIFFNFRADRARELTRAFIDPHFNGFNRKRIIENLDYTCLTQYDVTIPNVSIAFPPLDIKNTLGEYLSSLGLKQLRIAETEKYAHVTFFFNGGVEASYSGEDRILVPSPQVPTYDMQPEMSAYDVTKEVLSVVEKNIYDVIILNFANLDMVGHTGVFEAAIKAVEAIDKCVGEIVDKVLSVNGQILLTADHGNAENMLTESDAKITAHSVNPVPLVCIKNDPPRLVNDGILADIAPTLLDLMGLKKPLEMTGNSLLDK